MFKSFIKVNSQISCCIVFTIQFKRLILEKWLNYIVLIAKKSVLCWLKEISFIIYLFWHFKWYILFEFIVLKKLLFCCNQILFCFREIKKIQYNRVFQFCKIKQIELNHQKFRLLFQILKISLSVRSWLMK